MQVIETSIPEVKVIEADKFQDERGYFTRLFRDNEFYTTPTGYPIREINRSLTNLHGTIRGLHMQKAPMAQDKLVQCIKGAIFDVAVDMRPESETYLKWVGVELVETRMLLVPKGFAHGFQTLENDTIVQYFVSQYYSPEHEVGFRWNDKKIGIRWPYPDQPTLSEKDSDWPLL